MHVQGAPVSAFACSGLPVLCRYVQPRCLAPTQFQKQPSTLRTSAPTPILLPSRPQVVFVHAVALSVPLQLNPLLFQQQTSTLPRPPPAARRPSVNGQLVKLGGGGVHEGLRDTNHDC